MNKTQREKVHQMRAKGESYASIGSITNLPVGTIKAFCSRNTIRPDQPVQNGICERCGKTLDPQIHCHAKRFCSAECRNSWWSDNRDKRVHNGTAHVCAHCKNEYASYDDSSRFCSHPCYIAYRFGEGVGNHDE